MPFCKWFPSFNIMFLGSSTLQVCACSVMSSSLQPHGLQPARILCPWDFPDKNTVVSCHFLLHIYIVACANASFLFMPEKYCIVWMDHTLFIHSPVDGQLGTFLLCLLWLMLLWTLAYRHLLESLFSVLLGTFIELGLLVHLAIALTFWLL